MHATASLVVAGVMLGLGAGVGAARSTVAQPAGRPTLGGDRSAGISWVASPVAWPGTCLAAGAPVAGCRAYASSAALGRDSTAWLLTWPKNGGSTPLFVGWCRRGICLGRLVQVGESAFWRPTSCVPAARRFC